MNYIQLSQMSISASLTPRQIHIKTSSFCLKRVRESSTDLNRWQLITAKKQQIPAQSTKNMVLVT